MRTLTKRAQAGLAVAVVGTTVLCALREILVGLLDSPWYLATCLLGASALTTACAGPRMRRFGQALSAAPFIVFGTYLCIAAGHLFSRFSTWDASVPGEAAIMLVWAVLTTSWWLVPGTALTLTLVSKLVWRGSRDEGAA